MTSVSGMKIQQLTPSAALRKFVKCYYYIDNPYEYLMEDTFFADGCVEAIFSVGWDFYKDGVREDRAKVIGQILKPRKLKITGKGRSFGIWFYPHTFSRFSRIPMSELNDRVIPWDTLFPESFADIAGNCMVDDDVDQLVNATDSLLLERLSRYGEHSSDQLVDYAINYLHQNKSTPDLNKLALSLNVTQRYLQKVFLTRVGFSQKHFARILRFQQTLQTLTQQQSSSLTALAYANLYYDQSHFIREFKSFTGMAPSAFRSDNLPINQHFIAIV